MKVWNVFIKAVLCGALPLCMLGGSLSVAAYSGTAPREKSAGANLRVMSYNVLVDNDESIDGWSWGKALGDRGDKAAACIDYYKPDVIGFQECNYKWHVALKENLSDYAFVNGDVPDTMPLENPDSLGKKDWMCTTILYNTKALKLVDNELVGYSVNYWGCIQRMRYVSTAVFEIKATGEKFVFISTHLDAEKDEKGQNNRLIQSDELAACIQRYKTTYQCPVIATGDYNSGYTDAPIQNVVSKAGMTAAPENRKGIDYILYSAGVSSKYFTAVGDAAVATASDHKPVFADLKVQEYHFPTTETSKPAQTTTSTTPTKGTGALVTKPVATQKTTNTTPDNAGNKTTTKAVTTATVAGEVTDAVTPSPDGTTATEATQTPESAPVVSAQPETDGTPVSTESEGLSGPVLALIGAGGVLVLLGAGIGIYLLLNKKK